MTESQRISWVETLVGKASDSAIRLLPSHIARGNHKLPTTTAIFNLCSAADCPSLKSGLCLIPNGKCYARKAEVQYKDVLPYRRRQQQLWRLLDADQFASVIELVNARARTKLQALRFNEAGDVETQADVDKLVTIARRLRESKIQAYVYTANPLLDWSQADALTVNGSGQHFANVAGIGNRFVATPAADIPAGATVCHGDCRRCNRCLRPHDDTIYCPLH